jgi:hypothetical protein
MTGELHVAARRPLAAGEVLGEPGLPVAARQLGLRLDQEVAAAEGVLERPSVRAFALIVLVPEFGGELVEWPQDDAAVGDRASPLAVIVGPPDLRSP